jgi:hypothetical protein
MEVVRLRLAEVPLRVRCGRSLPDLNVRFVIASRRRPEARIVPGALLRTSIVRATSRSKRPEKNRRLPSCMKLLGASTRFVEEVEAGWRDRESQYRPCLWRLAFMRHEANLAARQFQMQQ